LIKLLATYEFKGEFYLLFPWAKANLREYWKQTPAPECSPFTAKWVLRQCKGIASGLLRIHGYQGTLDALEDLGAAYPPPEGTGRHCPESNGRTYNRHGDIKPENILWSDEDTCDDDIHFNERGILLISDFGLMKSYKDLTIFRQTPEEVRGSAMYEPPEVAESRGPKVFSRAYDVWSLGCVYLEFVTWLVTNFEGLENFREARLSEGNNASFFMLGPQD
jgi:serine/threonine protein kinase